ncbi:MAG: hypothetical protein H8E12_14370 [Rhodobacteraceae bacterium]|nr:hypothetical protein [Paracoccaceae bacterium]
MTEYLFVFDFDDTLAETIATIGVARTSNGKNDTLFRQWLIEHDLFPVSEEKADGLVYYYLTSEDFATYQKFASNEISDNTVEHFDFSDTSGVNKTTSKENTEIVKILKRAEGTKNSRVIIVTARGNSEFNSPFGKVTPTNRDDISNFLKSTGAEVNGNQVFPVGSSDPEAKARIVRRYIDALNPKVVYFYDDNDLNIEAIHQLCDEYKNGPNIITYKVKQGLPGESKEC